MQTLKSFLDQAMMIWSESTGAGRVGIALLLMMCVGGIVGVGVWSSQPNYVPLFGELTPEKSAEVVSALSATDVNWKLKGSTMVVVDKSDLARARIATAQLDIAYSGQTYEDVPIWADPDSQHEIYRRNMQKQLENAIAKFASVKSAEVILSIPKRQAFMRETDEPSASVVIEIAPKAKFGESQAAAIATFVANSASGMKLENVSITDTKGIAYSSDSSTRGNVGSQEEFRLGRERELTMKAEQLLTRVLGIGNATVAVTTDFSFGMETVKATEYSDDKVIFDSTENTTTTKQGRGFGSGTASNVGDNTNNLPSEGGVVEQEDITSKYKVPETIRTTTNQTPKKNMTTVSVVVNKLTVQDENKSVPANVKDQLTSLVSNAVGLDDATDQITVEFMEFVDLSPVESEEPVAAIPWDQINQILKNMSLGFAALVALFIGLKVLKSFQPGQLITGDPEPVPQTNQLSEMVKENPEVFSKIIATWSALESKPESDLKSKAA